MNPAFLDARRLLNDYRTLSGIKVEDDAVASYFEMYRDTFFECLDRLGLGQPDDLAKLLQVVSHYEHVGDFLEDSPPNLHELSAYGLVLLDRIAVLGWGRVEPLHCFTLHEQLFECFEYVHEARKRRSRAQETAARRHIKNDQPKIFVASEWQAYRVEYANNKSAFARVYVRLLKQRFGVDITEKQLREVWLRDTPSARKPTR